MDFVAIIGDPGSGKTNMLVRQLYKEYLDGANIISNIRSVKFPQTYMDFDKFIEAAENDDPRLDGAVIGTDEFGVGADSYEFLSERNKGLTKLNTQRRKFRLKWLYTVQRQNFVSRRLRQLTEGYISMSDPDKRNMRFPDGTKARHHRDVCMGVFRSEFFDFDGTLIKARWFNGRKYWSLYDDRERINIRKSKGGVLVPDAGEDEDY